MKQFGTAATHVSREDENTTDLLLERLRTHPSVPIFEHAQADGSYTPMELGDFVAEVKAVAKGLIASGLDTGDAVAILSRTRYEWALVDWAIWWAGGVSVPVYETSSPSQIQWIASDSSIRFAVVEAARHAEDVESVRDQVPTLEHIGVIEDGIIEELKKRGADVDDEQLEARRTSRRMEDIATIIYTSGTTGRPKGAELTHGNFASLATNAVAAVPEVFAEGGRTLLFLPLAHVFARFIEVFAVAGGSVLGHWGDVKTVTNGLGTFKPTFVLAVPRVFEKVYNSAEQKAAVGGKLKIFQWATATAIEWSRAQDTGGASLWLNLQHMVAGKLVYGKLLEALGGEIRFAVSGGGPLGERLGHFFRGVGLTILEGYGLTETTAPTSVNRPAANRIGTVGTQLPGCGVKIAADGEILLKGVHVFRGYHGNAEATAETFDGEWFRTGDLGALDDDGFLSITGRKKEIIVTAGGKNVAPAALEDRIRAHALVSQCVVVGDNRPFIGALITLDPDGLPGWLKMHDKAEMSIEQARTDPDVLAALDHAVTRANQSVSRAESIRKFAVLPEDLTVENGYLTPSLKVKRSLVLSDFSADVDALYVDDRGQSPA